MLYSWVRAQWKDLGCRALPSFQSVDLFKLDLVADKWLKHSSVVSWRRKPTTMQIALYNYGLWQVPVSFFSCGLWCLPCLAEKGSMAESFKSRITWDRLVSLKDLGFTARVRVKLPKQTFIYDCFGFGLTKRILKYFLIPHHPRCVVLATSHGLWFLIPGPSALLQLGTVKTTRISTSIQTWTGRFPWLLSA